MNDRINDLRLQLIEIQDGKPWIGSNFSKKLMLVDDEDFFKRPADNMHSVAEIIAHLTTWRNETRLKIESGRGALTDDHPSNWRSVEELKPLGRDQILYDYSQSLSRILGATGRKERRLFRTDLLRW